MIIFYMKLYDEKKTRLSSHGMSGNNINTICGRVYTPFDYAIAIKKNTVVFYTGEKGV